MRPISKILIAVAGFAAFSAGRAEAGQLVSYRALYDVRLANVMRGANVTDAGGKVAYGVKETCDAWVANQSTSMQFQTNTGDVISQSVTFSSWEAHDGTLYRFTGAEDGNDAATILGGAKLARAGAGGEAQFTKPEAHTYKLPIKTMFPVKHTEHILEAAAAGNTQFENMVFEGIEVEGAKLLVTFVSTMSKSATMMAARQDSPQMKRPGWNFRMAYFDPTSQAGAPMYEIEVDYLDNGIPVRWVLDYGEFSVEMGLSKIDILPPPTCGNG